MFIWQGWPIYFCGIGRVRYQFARYFAGMPDAWIEHSDDRTYFTDATGLRWRVHDVAYGPPHAQPHDFRRLGIGDRRATTRVFVSAGGERRSYRFERGESRELSPELCERQLARAGFLAKARFYRGN